MLLVSIRIKRGVLTNIVCSICYGRSKSFNPHQARSSHEFWVINGEANPQEVSIRIKRGVLTNQAQVFISSIEREEFQSASSAEFSRILGNQW